MGGGITIPEVFKGRVDVAQGDRVVLGHRLDSVTSEVFSNINDSVISK